MEAAFNQVWRDHFITWTIAERLRVALTGLGRELPDDAFARVVRGHAEMEVDIPPDLIEGMDKTLAKLSRHYKLGIISDAIVTPGTGLRELLDLYDLRQYFTGFAFSDEIGYSKTIPPRSSPPPVKWMWRSARWSTWATATITTSRAPRRSA